MHFSAFTLGGKIKCLKEEKNWNEMKSFLFPFLSRNYFHILFFGSGYVCETGIFVAKNSTVIKTFRCRFVYAFHLI